MFCYLHRGSCLCNTVCVCIQPSYAKKKQERGTCSESFAGQVLHWHCGFVKTRWGKQSLWLNSKQNRKLVVQSQAPTSKCGHHLDGSPLHARMMGHRYMLEFGPAPRYLLSRMLCRRYNNPSVHSSWNSNAKHNRVWSPHRWVTVTC